MNIFSIKNTRQKGLIALIAVFITSLFVDKSLPVSNWELPLLGVILLAGLFNVFNIFLTNYGFQYVEIILASNLLMLESVFAIGLGLLFFTEIPSLKELIGGAILIGSAIGMNYAEKENTV